MKTSYLFLIIALFAVCFVQTAEAQIPAKGGYVLINKSTQTLKAYFNGQLRVESVCGTGSGFTQASTTHNGRHKILSKGGPNYFSKKFGAPMPYAMMFTDDGDFLHGSYSFVTMMGKGMPQSHGCVRLPISVAKELDSFLHEGDIVEVVGEETDSIKALDIPSLYEDLPGGLVRMKIAGPNPSAADVKKAREMWVTKKLFSRPRGETDRSKIRIGYPCMPDNTLVPLLQFESAILTPQERAGGVHLTFDHSGGKKAPRR